MLDAQKQILSLHRDQLEKVTTELLVRETLDGVEFYKLVGKEMPRAKEPVPLMPVSGAVAALVQKGAGQNGR
ncbi:MAG TPA: hypothetical protein VEL06_16815 [Haliangiales bacterium]|nr:hypothetical protein [Haliangiales bacterium]